MSWAARLYSTGAAAQPRSRAPRPRACARFAAVKPSTQTPGAGGPDRTGADRVAALFDRESGGYDDAHEGPRAPLLHARMAAVLEALGPGGGTVLDAGMGPGRLCAELDARGWQVSGVDISAQMVALAARRLPHARARLLQGSITELPFPGESFDAVTATGVLEYVTEPAAAVAELMRVLAPGGVAAVSIPNPDSLRERWTRSVLYPATRAAKRSLPGFARPAPHRKPPAIRLPVLAGMLREAGAASISVRHACVEVVPPPLDLAAPRVARRLSQGLEPPRTRAARALATQVVVAARKPR